MGLGFIETSPSSDEVSQDNISPNPVTKLSQWAGTRQEQQAKYMRHCEQPILESLGIWIAFEFSIHATGRQLLPQVPIPGPDRTEELPHS